jgi:hypothetical protein
MRYPPHQVLQRKVRPKFEWVMVGRTATDAARIRAETLCGLGSMSLLNTGSLKRTCIVAQLFRIADLMKTDF